MHSYLNCDVSNRIKKNDISMLGYKSYKLTIHMESSDFSGTNWFPELLAKSKSLLLKLSLEPSSKLSVWPLVYGTLRLSFNGEERTLFLVPGEYYTTCKGE